MPSGETVTLQKVNANEWELIADTASTTAASGGALSLATALTDAQKKAWRNHFGSWHLDVTDDSTLPAIANYNGPDGILLGQSGDTTVQFADISDRSTMLTAGVAGDLMLLFARGWVRVGNLFTGGAAAVAARALAEANAVWVNRLHVFETVVVNPGGIPDNNFPQYLGLSLANKVDPRRVVSIRVKIGGQQAAASVDSATLAPFNDLGSGPLTQRGRGGILNLTLDAATRANLKNAVGSSTQYVLGEIEYKFEGTSLQPDVLPDVVDHFAFATNNNGYPAISGLSEAQVDARVAALRPTRFETVVGASAAAGNVPAGTHTLEVMADIGTGSEGRYGSQHILLSSLNVARKIWLRGEGQDEIQVSLSYVAATRTLTYSTAQGHPNNAHLEHIKAIGEA